MITFFGVARADVTLVSSSDTTPEGIAIFERSAGSNFYIVLEGRPGGTGIDVGDSTFNWDPADPTVLPDLQIWASRPLGLTPTTAVCDDTAPDFGGVPALASDMPLTQTVADTINDLACRFKDASGSRLGRGANDACTTFDDGRFHFVVIDASHPELSSTIQYCAQVGEALTFPNNETVLTARIRDIEGHVSAPASIVVRVTH